MSSRKSVKMRGSAQPLNAESPSSPHPLLANRPASLHRVPMQSRRAFPAIVALLVAAASLPAQSSVWKVTRGENELYLGGTCHVLRPADFPLPPEFDAAFAASTIVLFETDLARTQSSEMQRVIATEGRFADGTTLETVLTPAAWQTVKEYCAQAAIPLGQVTGLKPWLFTLMMAAIELQKIGVSAEGVDLHYFKKASAAGKNIRELESFERHLEFLVQLGAGRESEMIQSSLEDLDEMPRLLTGLLAAWKAGDLASIDRLMLQDLRTKYPTIFEALIRDRNHAWLPKLEDLLETRAIEYVLVGVGHMAGQDGLLALLRARGCTVEQIKSAPAPRQ